MKREVYAKLSALLDVPPSSCPNFRLVLKEAGLSRDNVEALVSLYAHTVEQKVIKTNSAVQEHVRSYADRCVLPRHAWWWAHRP